VAGLLSILIALARAVWREVRSLSSFTGNNLFLFVLLVMYQQWQSGLLFLMLFAVLLLGPLSGDPLQKIPADRLALWPLTLRRRLALRFGSLALSPILWISLPFLFAAGGLLIATLVIAAALLIQLTIGVWNYLTSGKPRWRAVWRVPELPGRRGGLIRKDLRQILSILDSYAALLLALSAMSYRWFSNHPDPDASMIMALVVVIALSTYAQNLFSLDFPSGIARYRLLPLRGREILMSKAISFLAIVAVLVVPLAPLAGFAAGLTALAVGQPASVLKMQPGMRWRFCSGTMSVAFVQVFLLAAVGVATARSSAWYLALALAGFLVSLWRSGRIWDRNI
jgi:predicted permease